MCNAIGEPTKNITFSSAPAKTAFKYPAVIPEVYLSMLQKAMGYPIKHSTMTVKMMA